MSMFKVAIFSLNQWALDFRGNTDRIIKSIDMAYESGAAYRAGPELELSGYSLEDAFFESDTVYHSWGCLKQILDHTRDIDMVIDIGMPVKFGSLYNCRVICYKGRVLCIRAKTSLAKDGIYREYRQFNEWPAEAGLISFKLPTIFKENDSSGYVPFGANFILELDKNHPSGTPLKVGWEICQELWDNKNVSANLYRNFGCHLVVNSSGSYWQLRKLDVVNDIVQGVTIKSGACYAFSNLVGCDGQRIVFYGRSCIYDNGKLVAITPTNSVELFEEIQMITYNINPRHVDENRTLISDRPDVALSMCHVWDLDDRSCNPSKIDSSYRVLRLTIMQNSKSSGKIIRDNDCSIPLALDRHSNIRFEEEIDHFVPLWLWDYLRRSGMKGFMMPLSGGLDSSTVAVLVFRMCNHIFKLLENRPVQDYFKNCHQIEPELLKKTLSSPNDICKLVLKCCYISTKFSSQETEDRARILSRAIGARFESISIQEIYDKTRHISNTTSPSAMDGVNLLEQNLQARLRMTMTYFKSEGNRIVLATGNVDEAIMGYLTKYDCSSADINPIGGLCKDDLKSYLKYCRQNLFASCYDLSEVLRDIIDAPPSAELTGAEQRDEDEIGLTYDEISVLGKVRRGIYGCSGPRSAFEVVWRNRNNPPFCTKIRCLIDSNKRDLGQVATEVGDLIKRFYQRYVRNRHKLTVLTPALHAESYSPDDNRFDHRQILYPPLTYQFKCIDELIAEIKKSGSIS